jgi:hypothetical protein
LRPFYSLLISSRTPCPIVSKDKSRGMSGTREGVGDVVRGLELARAIKLSHVAVSPSLTPAPLFGKGCSFRLQMLERTVADKETPSHPRSNPPPS